ncbi:hypothetical protein MVI27_09845 [Chryseobacterium salipaludis]|uniref:hypothetical protein n=1 Tax=Chryseobacterium TaxID=59732 RepID=UPI001FF55195|nr:MULTISPECIES: hypothetical protein [Chryseobacterium]MCJ8498563.1 hypothetical protein [Chryseobacterium salipaludis]MCX3297112.1 hypothetical protein [Planobacterium sp. JC490]
MALKVTYPDFKKNHENIVRNAITSIQEAIEQSLMEVVILAKKTNTYKDQTNNLRSSIGYVLYYNGEIVGSHFSQDGQGTKGDGAKGKQDGLEIARQAAQDAGNNGFIGVLVAGMSYARFVEDNGKDVITGSWLQIGDILDRKFADIRKENGLIKKQ